MKSGFNINVIGGDGYLIIPLSMGRLTMGQNPENIYKIFDYFAKKLANYSNDVIFLYTSGLYLNADNVSSDQRIKINEQMINHSLGLRKLIHKRKTYMPNAFHYLPIEYVILNSKHYRLFVTRLKKLAKTDKKFQKAIQEDMGDRPYTSANINFIIEEVAVAHIIRQHLVELPRTLVRRDIWRLFAYPGKHMSADAYQWKKKILPQNDKINPFAGASYDFNKKRIVLFDEV
ncbi:hypothetical protein ACFL0V_07420 [Nanoarchaeota archaeon]